MTLPAFTRQLHNKLKIVRHPINYSKVVKFMSVWFLGLTEEEIQHYQESKKSKG
ncbi:MAG: hypothetical protein L0Y35_03925 [Flammeovirgaceae bacterium]|nr:hypothetical protein [Flammeovirgaceae bacterium]